MSLLRAKYPWLTVLPVLGGLVLFFWIATPVHALNDGYQSPDITIDQDVQGLDEDTQTAVTSVVREEAKRGADDSGVLGAAGNAILGMLTWIIDAISSVLGQIIILLVNYILQPVLQYSDFINHQMVVRGWELVRNLANTGFIALMLIIAFGTMFGVSKVSWQQNIPKLVIAAIAVNFSRLIVGLLIDVGQVVMIAFVNAINQIGWANFTDLVGLKDAKRFTEDPKGLIDNPTFAIFASSIFAMIQIAITLIVLVVMIAVLVYRIIVIWLLIILAPAAFLASAASGILGPAGQFYSTWWSKLSAAIIIGPVLAFFLWLSLASVDQLVTDSFKPVDKLDNVAILNQGADPRDFLSYVIGIALLIAGLEVAGQFAGQVGGFAAKTVQRGSGMATMLAAAPATLAAGAALATGRFGLRKTKEGAREGAMMAGDYAMGKTAGLRSYATERLSKFSDQAIARGGFAALAGRAARGVGGKMGEVDKTFRERAAKQEAGFGKTMNAEQAKAYVEKYKEGTVTQRQRSAQLMSQFVGDEDKFAQMMESDPKTGAQWLKDSQESMKAAGDEKGLERTQQMLAKNPQWKHGTADEIGSALDGMEEKQLRGLDPRVWNNSNFREAARNNPRFKQMFTAADGGTATDEGDVNRARFGWSTAHLQQIDRTLGDKTVNALDKQEQTRFQAENDALSRLDMNNATNKQRAASNTALQQFINGEITDTLTDVISQKGFRLEDINLAQARASGNFDEAAFARILAKAMSKSEGTRMFQSLTDAGSARNGNVVERARANEVLTLMRSAGFTAAATAHQTQLASEGKQAQIVNMNVNRSVMAGSAAPLSYNNTTGALPSAEARRQFATSVGKDPTALIRLEADMNVRGGDNDLTRGFVESLKTQSLDGYLKNHESAAGTPAEDIQRRTLNAVRQQLQNYQAVATAAATRSNYTDDMRKNIDKLIKHFDTRVATQYRREPRA